MELENIILSEVSPAQKAKSHMYSLSHMWDTDLIHIQQYYENLVTLRGGHIREGWSKKETEKMNMVDTFSIQQIQNS
jgi:hypothetical protein